MEGLKMGKLTYETKLTPDLNEETREVEFSAVYENGEVAENMYLDLIGLVEAYCKFDSEMDAVFEAQALLYKVTQWMDGLNLPDMVTDDEYDAHMDVKDAMMEEKEEREGVA
jgi:hypothetical protein